MAFFDAETQPTASTAPASSETSSGSTNNLSYLVPNFDPGKDDLLVYSQKVELLSSAWPESRITELTARLILGCSGSAFQKLQIHQAELINAGKPGVRRLIELLGGYWGRIPLERKYETAEKALFRCTQRNDETNDSYLARADIIWSELLTKGTTLEEIQAYVVLRGSTLSNDDKKRVVLESDSAGKGQLEMSKVSASIRLLGAGFFHEMVSGKKVQKQKTYDTTAFVAEETEPPEETEAFNVWSDEMEDDQLDSLLADGDEDAAFIMDYEAAASDVLQGDAELAAAFSAYTDARRRLSEKSRFRGFWPVQPGKGPKGKGGKKGKGYSSSKGGSRRTLQQRILNSHCRLCGQKGHWRAECPLRSSQNNGTSGSRENAPVNQTVSQQGTFTGLAVIEDDEGMGLPMEFLNLPERYEQALDASRQPQQELVFMTMSHFGDNHSGEMNEPRVRIRRMLNKINQGQRQSQGLRPSLRPERASRFKSTSILPVLEPSEMNTGTLPVSQPSERERRHMDQNIILQTDVSSVSACSQGAEGVLDTGATKTVIGSRLISDFLKHLRDDVRKTVSRSPCDVTFRFGNQGTLRSEQALVLPLGELHLRIAIVPGYTPLLISNTLIRTLRSTIHTQQPCLESPYIDGPVPLRLTTKGLYVLDLNCLACRMMESKRPTGSTYLAEEVPQTGADAGSELPSRSVSVKL